MSDARPDHSAYPALDGIRGMAVVLVVTTHCAYWTGRYESGPGRGLLARADFGVALFFVLSGFLLSRGWLRAAARGTAPPAVRVYFWRRAVRILPAYWFAVVAAMLLLGQNRRTSTPPDWLRQLTLTQIYHPSWFRAGLTQTWSLCTEVAFYLLLPVLGIGAVLLRRRVGWRPGLLLASCGVLVGVSVAWNVVDRMAWGALWSPQFWLPGYLDWFAGGIALAVVTTHLDTGARWFAVRQIGASAGACWLIAAALLLVAATPIAGPRAIGLSTGGTAVTKNLLYLVAAVAVVAPAVLGDSQWPELIFGNRPARRLGLVSYSVFTLHLLVLEVVHRDLLGYPVFQGSLLATEALVLPASIAVGWLSYRFVETPAMRLRGLVESSARARSSTPR